MSAIFCCFCSCTSWGHWAVQFWIIISSITGFTQINERRLWFQDSIWNWFWISKLTWIKQIFISTFLCHAMRIVSPLWAEPDDSICRCAAAGIPLSGRTTWTPLKVTAWYLPTSWTAGPTTAPRWGGEPSRGRTGWGGLWTAPAPSRTPTTPLVRPRPPTGTSAYLCPTSRRSARTASGAARPRGATRFKDSTGAAPVSRTRTAAPRIVGTKCHRQGKWLQRRCPAGIRRSKGTLNLRTAHMIRHFSALPVGRWRWRRTRASMFPTTTWPKACCASMKNLRMRSDRHGFTCTLYMCLYSTFRGSMYSKWDECLNPQK